MEMDVPQLAHTLVKIHSSQITNTMRPCLANQMSEAEAIKSSNFNSKRLTNKVIKHSRTGPADKA